MRHSVSATALAPQAGQQMTKQTLQALSAVPRTRIVKNDQWVQRRKSDGPRITQDFNYQHWLIQVSHGVNVVNLALGEIVLVHLAVVFCTQCIVMNVGG